MKRNMTQQLIAAHRVSGELVPGGEISIAIDQTLTQDAPKLFPMYTPGFAAPELYKKNQQLGPWTDIYGLGASMYACMLGAPPQPADQRTVHDKVDTAMQAAADHYSQQLLDLVNW